MTNAAKNTDAPAVFLPDLDEALRAEVRKAPFADDIDGDGVVDPLDSGFVLARFGCPVGTGDPSCDIADQNGIGLSWQARRNGLQSLFAYFFLRDMAGAANFSVVEHAPLQSRVADI